VGCGAHSTSEEKAAKTGDMSLDAVIETNRHVKESVKQATAKSNDGQTIAE